MNICKKMAAMNVQALKLELIKSIADTQNEQLLTDIQDILNTKLTSKKQNALTRRESELLLKINEGLPESVQNRYTALLSKSAQEMLTEREQEELVLLIPEVEKKSAERLEYLIQLATIWNISLDETMARLGIHTPSVI
jgi:hypothetical protein